MVDVAQIKHRQKLSNGAIRYSRETVKTRDSFGQVTMWESEGDLAVAGDEQCVRTTYASGGFPDDRVSETSTMPNFCSVPVDTQSVIAWSRYYYDNKTTLGSVMQGLLTKAEELTGSATRTWWTTATITYDGWSRVTKVTDALAQATSYGYTHTTGGLLSSMTITSADPDGSGPLTPLLTTTTFDTRTGHPIKTVEPGGQTTEATLDGLGRVTAVWLPGRAKTLTPSKKYEYTNATAGAERNAVKTLVLQADGITYVPSVTIFDSFLRPRQTQTADTIRYTRNFVDTSYNSAGEPVLIDEYNVGTRVDPRIMLEAPSSRTAIRRSHRLSYDFAGRVTNDALYGFEVYYWATATVYGGDRVAVTPPQGGTPTTTISDVFGRVTDVIEHLGPSTAYSGVTTKYAYNSAGNLTKVIDSKGDVWQYTWDLQGNRISEQDPDRGLTQSVFSKTGLLLSTTDARGVTIWHVYDALGRETSTTTAKGALLTSTAYDTVKKGLVASQTRYAHGVQFVDKVDIYDTAGRPTKTTTVIPAVTGLIGSQLAGSYSTTYTYNHDGSLSSQVLPKAGPLNAETLTYGYTAVGFPYSLTGTIGSVSTQYVSTSSYYSNDLFASFTAEVNGVGPLKSVVAWDASTERVNEVQVWGNNLTNAPSGGNLSLNYDQAGNITRVHEMWPGLVTDNQCFAYDFQRQLVDAWSPSTYGCSDPPTQSGLGGPAPYWHTWGIDTIGRVASKTDRTKTTSSTTNNTHPTAGATAVRPHTVTSAVTTGSTSGTRTYGYDAAGNMTSRLGPSGATQTLTWDEQGNPVQISEGGTVVARMVYDAQGSRLVRQQGSVTTVYVAGAEITLTGSTLSAVRYYSHHGQLVAARTSNANSDVWTLIADWQGTTHVQINHGTRQATLKWQDPYGQVRGQTGTGWVGEHGFVGGIKDDSGLTRIGARDYDPTLGAFITSDPIRSSVPPLGLNAYRYGYNSPATFSDRSGLKPLADGDYEYRSDGKGGWDLWSKPTTMVGPVAPGTSNNTIPGEKVLSEPKKPTGGSSSGSVSQVLIVDAQQRIDEYLRTNSERMENLAAFFTGLNPPWGPSGLVHTLKMFTFVELVKSHAYFDIKRQVEWQYLHGGSKMKTEFMYFNGQLWSAEQLGNYVFGYMGAAYGYNEEILCIAAGIYQAYEKEIHWEWLPTYFDEKDDNEKIRMGWNAYWNR